MGKSVNTYVFVARFVGDATWKVLAVNADTNKLKEHVQCQVKAQIEKSKVFKLNGVTGEMGRYFLD